MNHLNSVLLEGVLVDNPKLIPLVDPPNGIRLVKFDVASDRFYVNREGVKGKPGREMSGEDEEGHDLQDCRQIEAFKMDGFRWHITQIN